MNKLLLLLVLYALPYYSQAITFEALTNELYKENQEIRITANKVRYSEFGVIAARSGFFPSFSFNNALSKGNDFEYDGSSVSNSASVPAGGPALPSGSGIQNVGSSNTDNEGWSSDISVSVPIFTRFAVASSYKTSKNNLRHDQLAHKDMKTSKKAHLIKLLLEINMLKKVKVPISKAKRTIEKVKQRSSLKRTKTLYSKKELLELDTKYYELLYHEAKVNESLELAKKAIKDLIPNFKSRWFSELPNISIQYRIPNEDDFKKLYVSNSTSEKQDTLQISSLNEIYSATKWERAWIPMVVASGSYGQTGDFKGAEPSDSWRASLGVTFELFDGFRSMSRRGQALHSKLMAISKRQSNRSKQLLYLKHSKLTANVSYAEYMHKMALSNEKFHKYKQSKRVSQSGVSTSFEQSILFLDYTMTKLEALDSLKKHQGAKLDIAQTLNKLTEVTINETN